MVRPIQWSSISFVLLIVSFCYLFLVVAAEEDLYKILGVSRSASTQEIKKAYRKKALDTHPDKNKDVPAEEAAAAFQRVVHAFEILSDKSSRNRYDRTGSHSSNGGGSGGRQQQHNGFTWTFRWNTQQRTRLKDKFSVKQAQSRILHIVSLEQLEVIMTTTESNGEEVDSSQVLERNLLICFYTPPLETHVMDNMVYPWPFAAQSSQGIWWEDMLQTTVVRFHRSNELTKFFDVPDGNQLQKPLFLFGKRGQKFHDPNTWTRRLSTDNRQIFDKWVWEQLRVVITFVNHHDHPVELYWIHERRATIKATIEPNSKHTLTTMLSHEWWVRDARTDTRRDAPNRNRLTDQTCLYNVKITSDTRTEYIIPKRNCYDMSGHCPYWNRSGRECSKNPNFMLDICKLTCRQCEQEKIVDDNHETHNDEKKKSSGSDEL